VNASRRGTKHGKVGTMRELSRVLVWQNRRHQWQLERLRCKTTTWCMMNKTRERFEGKKTGVYFVDNKGLKMLQ